HGVEPCNTADDRWLPSRPMAARFVFTSNRSAGVGACLRDLASGRETPLTAGEAGRWATRRRSPGNSRADAGSGGDAMTVTGDSYAKDDDCCPDARGDCGPDERPRPHHGGADL